VAPDGNGWQWRPTGGTDSRERETPDDMSSLPAVQFSEKGGLVRMHLNHIGAFANVEVPGKKYHLESGNVAPTNALGCLSAMQRAGWSHQWIATGGETPNRGHSALSWLHTTLGNVRRLINGSIHHVSPNHLPPYLAKISHRFNCRLSPQEVSFLRPYVTLRTCPCFTASSSWLRIASCQDKHW